MGFFAWAAAVAWSGSQLDRLGVLSSSSSTQTVTFSAESDFDSILTHCEHSLTAGTARTACNGTVRGQFVPAEEGFAAFYVAAQLRPRPFDLPAGLTDALSGLVTIDCGVDGAVVSVENSSGVSNPVTSGKATVDIQEGTPCQVQIDYSGEVTTSAMAVATALTQTISVTMAGGLAAKCTRSAQCPAEAPICGADGACGKSDEGQSADVAAVHCATPYVSQLGCSWGVSGSKCRGDFECRTDAGYTCSLPVGVCAERQSSGGPCASNQDCQGFTGCNIGTGTCN
jgi:hypothetical protein